MLREREKVVNNFIAVIDVIIAWVSFHAAMLFYFGDFSFVRYKDSIILHFIILVVWYLLSRYFRLSQLHRSRPFSAILFSCLALSLSGSAILALSVFSFELHYIGFEPIQLFLALNIALTFIEKIIVYSIMKYVRKRGRNTRSILIVGDESSIPFIRKVINSKEWGYRLVGILGPDSLMEEFGNDAPILDHNLDIHDLLVQKTIDELIYCKKETLIQEVEELSYSCSEVGVVFRMYSPFFNMLRNKAHIHYYDTIPMLTISNTPMDYLSLQVKGIFDFLFSFFVVIALSPVFLIIALIIKITDRGPVFFKQKRVGLRGRKFYVYKFRTMVVNAEALKDTLMAHNEMDGPTFKMTNDPRITKIGHFLRKTSLDELPQFFNVIMGDMSIVGPRPPVPSEVRRYERWQLRRLSMKPGITCIWQVSGRNNIAFDDWMRMDMEYIDNWSLKMDFVIFLKTIRTMIVADGK